MVRKGGALPHLSPRSMVRYPSQRGSVPSQKDCVILCSGIALLVGVGLTISGATVLSTALKRDPATDFSDMGVCKIDNTSVTRKTDSSTTRTQNGRQRTEYTCNDEYVYTFCLPTNLQFCSWKSKTDTKQVCGRRCEECTNTDTTPTFVDGEETQCWEPAPDYTPSFPYVGPSAPAIPAERIATATRTSASWSDCSCCTILRSSCDDSGE